MMTETLANIHITKKKPEMKTISNGTSKMASQISMFHLRNSEGVKRSGSFVIGQKLRESKWFTHSEIKIFCAVVETGFLIEHKNGDKIQWGVAIWAPTFEKSKNAEYLTIYTITETKGKFKVLACRLEEFWPESTQVRINNKSDKSQTPLSEEVIRNQISAVENSKRKWHNTEHFAYFCRYGPAVTNVRIRKITDQLRWNTGTFFLKIRSLTAK